PAVEARATVSTFGVGKDGLVVAAVADPRGPAELYTRRPGAAGINDALMPLTTLNKDLLGAKTLADVEAFTFRTFDKREIEATSPGRRQSKRDARGIRWC